MPRCLIGLGANLLRPTETLDEAVARLHALSGVAVEFHSAAVRSRPVGPPGQADYRNSAALLTTSWTPPQLLRALLDIELQLGRRRGRRWEARTIDLDLLLYDDLRIHQADLVVPHPWLLVRRFALGPAAALAPQMMHPLVGQPLAALLAAFDSPQIAVCGGDDAFRQAVARRASEEIARRMPAVAADCVATSLDGPAARAIVVFDSPADVYAGRGAIGSRAAVASGRPLLVLPMDSVESAALAVADAWTSMAPLVDAD